MTTMELSDRDIIDLVARGNSQSAIARIGGVHRSTIMRRIRRIESDGPEDSAPRPAVNGGHAPMAEGSPPPLLTGDVLRRLCEGDFSDFEETPIPPAYLRAAKDHAKCAADYARSAAHRECISKEDYEWRLRDAVMLVVHHLHSALDARNDRVVGAKFSAGLGGLAGYWEGMVEGVALAAARGVEVCEACPIRTAKRVIEDAAQEDADDA